MNNLPSFFGVSYLINLPERADRLKSAKKQFKRVGWQIGPLEVNIFQALRYVEPKGFPSAPVRGCFHSHLECLRAAHARTCRSVLILEDDIALSTSLPRLTPAIWPRLAAEDWDFVYFAYSGIDPVPTADRYTREREFRFDEWTGTLETTSFYGINARILPRLIAHLSNLSNGQQGDQEAGPMPIDGAYNIFRRNNPRVRCLIARPALGWQMPSRSDISPHALDKIAFLRPVNSAVRKLKQVGRLWRS